MPGGCGPGDRSAVDSTPATGHQNGTHQDPRCAAGCVAVAGAVALALRERAIVAESFAAELAALVEPADSKMAGFLRTLPQLVTLSPEQALPAIAPLGKTGRDEWPGISPFVVGTVMWSLHAFLRSPEEYSEAVLTAIGVGGDVDTTAAITGAIAGAHVGLGRVPSRWVSEVTDRGEWATRAWYASPLTSTRPRSEGSAAGRSPSLQMRWHCSRWCWIGGARCPQKPGARRLGRCSIACSYRSASREPAVLRMGGLPADGRPVGVARRREPGPLGLGAGLAHRPRSLRRDPRGVQGRDEFPVLRPAVGGHYLTTMTSLSTYPTNLLEF